MTQNQNHNISPAEKAALDEMKAEILEVKVRAYETLELFLGDTTLLPLSGFKDMTQVLHVTMAGAADKIKRLTQAHLRKYPD